MKQKQEKFKKTMTHLHETNAEKTGTTNLILNKCMC